ncbi:MAG: AbrB family transcriptional regulator [Cyanobacteriota bacterium]|nr:AbrB family transcriptional regulator [Cyanobacteriota bacterium]
MAAYLWTIMIGLAGAWVGIQFKVPAGALVGSMLAVGLVNACGAIAVPNPPSQVRLIMQVVLGITLGSRLTAEVLVGMKDLWRPALLCTGIAVGTGVLSAYLISRWLGVERMTALLGTAPGGITDMSLIALDMGAQTSTVMVMHLARLISVIVVVPWIVRWLVQAGGV